ncbi:MAG: ATP-binding cassette domain-containing protein [Chitinophagaceae bacterium]
MAPFAIETTALSFSFNKRQKVVDTLSLQVPQGSIFGFLGPNGAGKTTTIRLLAGMLLSGNDDIFIHGQSLQKTSPYIFQTVGCLIETPSLYLHLTAKENLTIITTLRGLPHSAIDRILQLVGLKDAAKRKVKEFSLGMKQRLGIGMALLPNPQLLILDEPVNGLDPNGIVEIREMLIRINREEGKTVFVSSHLLNEIEKTCTHIGVINRGVLRYQGTLEEMKHSAYSTGEVVFKMKEADHWLSAVQQTFTAAKRQAQDEIIFPFSTQEEVAEINRHLVALQIPVTGIQVRGGLEEWFMKIINQDHKQMAQ